MLKPVYKDNAIYNQWKILQQNCKILRFCRQNCKLTILQEEEWLKGVMRCSADDPTIVDSNLAVATSFFFFIIFLLLLRIQLYLVEDSDTGRFALNVGLGKHVLIG